MKINIKKLAKFHSQNGVFKGIPAIELENFFANSGPELLMRLFLAEIQPLLFRGNNFLSRARNDDAFVDYDSVQLAQSGTIPNATVNRTALPAIIAPRADSVIQYNLEEITVDPVLIGVSEELTIAYNKRQSIIEQQAETIMQVCGDRALYRWTQGANAAHIIQATGTSRAAGNTNGYQTGNRAGLAIADLAAVQKQFFTDNVANELEDIQGVAILTPAMYQDLVTLGAFTQYLQYGTAILPSGVIRRAYGFDFYVRQSVSVLNSSQVVYAPGAVGATSDTDASVFYSPKYVRRAVGPYIPFVSERRPEYYGSIFSALIRFGASAARSDSKGIVVVYE